jgi:hypothetical protein
MVSLTNILYEDIYITPYNLPLMYLVYDLLFEVVSYK